MFSTQTEARQFFVTQIVDRARIESIPLSVDEQQMLLWSESEPDPGADPALAERLAADISDADYETKIAGLLKRSFDTSAGADATARDRWEHAWRVLRQGDHYLLVMIERAIGGRRKPWWQFW